MYSALLKRNSAASSNASPAAWYRCRTSSAAASDTCPWKSVPSFALRHSVRMSLGVCPGPSPKFWRLVGCFKFRSLGAKTTLRSVAFQPCIWMGGVNIVKIGEKHDFVQILGLKTPISVDRNFEHLTSEGSVTRNFEISSSLTPSLQNMDIDGPN